MTIHFSKVVFRDGKYYFKKGISDIGELVTAKVLFFSESGELECDFNFKDGVFSGVQKLYKDVYYQLSSEENYKNGIVEGISRFYKDGTLYKEAIYKDGNLNSEEYLNT
jgi:antitoxin component YwqK of YwqJK toxin-antitoxin module